MTPRWKSIEIRIYLLVVSLSLCYMLYTVYSISDGLFNLTKENANYSHLLSPGYLFRKLDNSDTQYASFRNNIPILALAGLIHVQSSRIGLYKLHANLLFSLLFLCLLNGVNILTVITMVSIGFVLSRYSVHAVWVYSIVTLFLNAYIPDIGGWRGFQSRWYNNFLVLRMISFAVDYSTRDAVSDQECCNNELCSRCRVNTPLQGPEYSFVNYLAYCLYTPLYIAGPIITFNDFIHQMMRPISIIHTRTYALRWLFAFALMEILQHLIYVIAITKQKSFELYTPFQIGVVGFFSLNHVWLKLLIIWRFFRLWALADGVETVENMARCMSNNYSAIGFWKGWHVSYNKWLVKYLYIPLGGNKRYMLNFLIVFTFVAVWHDLSMKLLAWGWLISLFVIPEIICKKLTAHLTDESYYVHFSALGGVVNIFMMMSANLVGFVVGLEGIGAMWSRFWTWQGLASLGGSFVFFYSLVRVMFCIREDELEKKQSLIDN